VAVDETYIEVKGEWKYLYRAVDLAGNDLLYPLQKKGDRCSVLDFLLCAKGRCPRAVINADAQEC